MKKSSNISHPLIALFLAAAVINVYVTESYCNFTKELKHCHAPVSSVESKPDSYSPIAEIAENHHHDQKLAAYHHEPNQPEADHHNSDDSESLKKHHHPDHEAAEHHHDKEPVEADHHHSYTSESIGNHHHDNQKPSQKHDDATSAECNHQKNGSKEDNCCEDDSAAFFSSLINPSVHFPEIKSPITFDFFHFNPFNELFLNNSVADFSSYLLFRPPPNIPDIRVFIQSFII